MVAPIAILGAGPSGLILARLLEINHIDYVVFERDPSSNAVTQGGSLDIHKNIGQLALEEAGLMEEFNAFARYDGQRAEMVDQYGNRIWLREDEGQNEKPEIDRKDLRSLLLNSIPSKKIQWNYKAESVQRSSDGTTSVKFSNSKVESGFKLIVGADGAWSKVRPLLTSATPLYSGLHYLQMSILPSNPLWPATESRVRRGSYVAIGSGKQIAAQYTGEGSYNIYIGVPLQEHWSKAQDLTKNEFADWAPSLEDWIKHSDGKIRAWPLYAMPVDSFGWRAQNDMVCIGDAAHVSTPFVGEGVNCSMYDGLELAHEIIKSGTENLDEAVARYEKTMFPRAVDLITRSAASGELLFAFDAPERLKALIMAANPSQ